MVNGQSTPPRERMEFASEEEWSDYQDAVEALRTWSIVAATGWTLTQLAEQDRTEVDRILRVWTIKRGVEAQIASMKG